jgi:hypothetical protein
MECDCGASAGDAGEGAAEVVDVGDGPAAGSPAAVAGRAPAVSGAGEFEEDASAGKVEACREVRAAAFGGGAEPLRRAAASSAAS